MTDRQVKTVLLVIPLLIAVIFVLSLVEPLVNRAQAVPAELPSKHYDIPPTERDITVGKVAAIYTAEIGVRELTNNNDGERVEEYLAVCGLGKGYAWCAAFVSWVFAEAGVETVCSAWSPSWFPAKNTIYTHGKKNKQEPERADVFGQYFANKKRIAHVGFIDHWGEGDYCITVEGNTTDDTGRENEGVYRRRRLKNQIYKVSRWI